ncbi:hypothetical protein SprV_0301107300 [Sparganum proliferum]
MDHSPKPSLVFDATAEPPTRSSPQEKCQEMHTNFQTAYFYLKKAFDKVNQDGLRKFVLKSDCPDRFNCTLSRLYDGMMAYLIYNQAVSEASVFTNGLQQSCVLDLTRFCLMFSAMLLDVYRDEWPGIRIVHRTYDQLLNTQRMQESTRTSKITADDRTVIVRTEAAPNPDHTESPMNGSGTNITSAENFAYLGNKVPRNIKIDDETQA